MKKLFSGANLMLVAMTVAACSTAAPSGSATPSAAASLSTPTTAAATSAPPTSSATPTQVSTPQATETPTETAPAPTTPSAGATTFTLVMSDGPRAGTWEVANPGGEVAGCQFLPDLERWIATWIGTPPLTFIDVRGEESDPFLMFTFSDEPNELGFLPTGEITFDADDRGDTATLTWVSESHEGNYRNSANENQGSVDVGQAELTIECGSIFRHT